MGLSVSSVSSCCHIKRLMDHHSFCTLRLSPDRERGEEGRGVFDSPQGGKRFIDRCQHLPVPFFTHKAALSHCVEEDAPRGGREIVKEMQPQRETGNEGIYLLLVRQIALRRRGKREEDVMVKKAQFMTLSREKKLFPHFQTQLLLCCLATF